MSDTVLGEVPEVEGARDAIHIAVIAVKAGSLLMPGSSVSIRDGVGVIDHVNTLGIVDPYRTSPIKKGDMFWLCLLPNTVTGMKHHWTHPAFSEDTVAHETDKYTKAGAEAWLREQCPGLGLTFEELIDPDSPLVKGDWLITEMNQSAQDLWYEIEKEFWGYYFAYTGRHVDYDDRGHFSCSC